MRVPAGCSLARVALPDKLAMREDAKSTVCANGGEARAILPNLKDNSDRWVRTPGFLAKESSFVVLIRENISRRRTWRYRISKHQGLKLARSCCEMAHGLKEIVGRTYLFSYEASHDVLY